LPLFFVKLFFHLSDKITQLQQNLNKKYPLGSFPLPLKVYPAIFVLHESATAYKHVDTKINAVCFAENIEILG